MKWVSLELEPQFSDLNKSLESSESENDRISFLKGGNSKKQNVSHFTGNTNNVLRQIRVKSVGQKKNLMRKTWLENLLNIRENQ